MKLQTQQKVFVLLTTVTSLLLALIFLASSILPWDIMPLWLMSGEITTIVITLWLYSVVNTFNYIWLNKRDILLELIQGFSAISTLLIIASTFGLLASIEVANPWIMQLSQLIVMVVLYLTLLRTLLNTRTNVWNNISRWISIVSASLFMGISAISLFVALDPADPIFNAIWNIVIISAITSTFLTPVLYYLPKKKVA